MFMRKEVRLGLAIGGVLLAVLVVYLLVVTAGSDTPQQVTLDTSSSDQPPTQPQNRPGAESSRRQPDPFATTMPAAEGAGQGTHSASADRWSTILSTGEVPMMLTETPTGAGSLGSSGSTSSGSGGPLNLSTSGGGSIGSSVEATNTGSLGATGTGAPAPLTAEANQPANNGGTPSVPIAANTGGVISSRIDPPPPAPGATSDSSSPRTHVVRQGETYASIAKVVYGSESYFPHLIRANPMIEARKLRPGMTINIPPVSEVRVVDTPRPQTQPPAQPLDPKTEYRVTEGDSLERISLKLYGKRDRTDKLYDLNKSTIGADPARLKIGMLLKLPEPPTR
jgi:nucleoid-associated protein YgaU